MCVTKSVLAIIPARGGSKGIKNKNIKELLGVPLIQYTINSAKKSKSLSKIIVSTDSKKIIKKINDEKIFCLKRSKELALDKTPMLPVIINAIEEEEKKGNYFDYVIILQPTCPLRTTIDIDQSLELLISSKSDSIVSVYQVDDEHPGRMYNLENNYMKPLFPSLISLNRQNLPPIYHRNGCIYAVKTQIVKSGSLFGNRVLPYIMKKENSVNIDNEIDWKIAEILINEQK